MKQSIVNICNLAISRMGGNQIKSINSLNDPTEEARECKRLYPQILSDLLRQHPFGFACVSEALAFIKLHEGRAMAYEYAYPANALRVWRVGAAHGLDNPGSPSMPYATAYGEQGTVILSAMPEAYALYSRYVDDPNRFDSFFVEAVAWSLASELALAVRNDIATAGQLKEAAAQAMEAARGYDANEQHMQQPEPYFITGRY